MRRRILLGWLTLFMLSMAACSPDSSGSAANPTSAPALTAAPQSLPIFAPTNAPIGAPTTNATQAPLIGVATATPVTGTDLITVTPTSEATSAATSEATSAPLSTQPPPPPPPSSGPLDFTVDVAGCKVDPSRAGGVIMTMRFNATGGSGLYTYYDEGQVVSQIFDRPATKGSSVIDAFRVDSGDQSISHKIQFKPNDYCH
ncbi:MAG TPA: hypothetical protein VFF70_05985 [Anaerolineae bacterium]|jgi:hypothetical protein|nr:hypothetical protein [Anaerolineae bacterium]